LLGEAIRQEQSPAQNDIEVDARVLVFAALLDGVAKPIRCSVERTKRFFGRIGFQRRCQCRRCNPHIVRGPKAKFAIIGRLSSSPFELANRLFGSVGFECRHPEVEDLARIHGLVRLIGFCSALSPGRSFVGNRGVIQPRSVVARWRVCALSPGGWRRCRENHPQYDDRSRAARAAGYRRARDKEHQAEQYRPLVALVAHGLSPRIEFAHHERVDVLPVDRLQIEHPGAGRYVGAVGGERDIAQEFAVETTPNGAAIRIPQQFARSGAGIRHVDFASEFVAKTDCDDDDPGFGGGLRGVERKRIVIFAVRDQQDYARRLASGAETLDGLSDRLLEPRPAPRHAVGPCALEHEP